VYGGMSREDFQKAQETERQLQQQDLLMEQTRDRKNQLESYVYDIRNKVSYFMLDLPPSVRLSI
jgi:heat shock 70kDa protein 4